MRSLISKYLRPCVNFVVLFHVLDGPILRYGAIRKQDRFLTLFCCSVKKNSSKVCVYISFLSYCKKHSMLFLEFMHFIFWYHWCSLVSFNRQFKYSSYVSFPFLRRLLLYMDVIPWKKKNVDSTNLYGEHNF